MDELPSTPHLCRQQVPSALSPSMAFQASPSRMSATEPSSKALHKHMFTTAGPIRHTWKRLHTETASALMKDILAYAW